VLKAQNSFLEGDPNPIDVAQLRKLHALQDSRSPQPQIDEKSGRELDIEELWRMFNLLNCFSAMVDNIDT
jgi:hypothetical protein